MQRIDSSDSQFHDGDPSTGALGTFLAAEWHNSVQEEIAGFVEGAGITLDPNDNGQLVKALSARLAGAVPLADKGAVNAYAATNIVPLTAQTLMHGIRQRVTIATTNNAASTYSPDGLPPKPIIGLDLGALSGLELLAGQVADLEYVVAVSVNKGNGAWLLVRCGGGELQVPGATKGPHAAQAQQIQQNAFNYGAVAGGTANALTATLTPAPAAYTDDLTVVVKLAANNTSATTLNVNGIGAKPVVGSAHLPLQGNELVANGLACFGFNTTLGSFVLLWSTGGSEQVGSGSQSNQAVNFGQFASSIAAGPGYTKLPNGLIIQWGSAISNTGSPNLTWTFPLAFPNQCNAVIGQPGAAGSIVTLLAQTPALAKQSAAFSVAAANGGAAMSGVAVGLISVGFDMGQKFTTYGANDVVRGFYDSADSPLPSGMEGVELSGELWNSLLVAQVNGMLLQKGSDGLPEAVSPPPPTQVQILATNQSQLNALLGATAVAIAPLQLAVSLGEATDAETTSAKAWVAYSRALNAVDLTVAEPAWPAPPAVSD